MYINMGSCNHLLINIFYLFFYFVMFKTLYSFVYLIFFFFINKAFCFYFFYLFLLLFFFCLFQMLNNNRTLKSMKTFCFTKFTLSHMHIQKENLKKILKYFVWFFSPLIFSNNFSLNFFLAFIEM